jgi:hypothetical protein
MPAIIRRRHAEKREDTVEMASRAVLVVGLVAIGLAAAGALVGKSGPWWILVLLALIALGKPVLDQVQALIKHRQDQRSVLERALTAVDSRGRLPQVDEVPPEAWGFLSPAIGDINYVRRDAEPEVKAALAEDKLAVIVGPSMSGKSRMAAELVRHHLKDQRVLIPRCPTPSV